MIQIFAKIYSLLPLVRSYAHEKSPNRTFGTSSVGVITNTDKRTQTHNLFSSGYKEYS